MVWVQISLLVLFHSLDLTNCNVMYDVKLVSKECLKNKAVVADYTPLGKIITIGNLSVYEYESTTNINSKRMLIGVYDIYGLGPPNLMQVADQIAVQSGGFRVALPDFFRGDNWRDDRDDNELPEWIQRVGDWDTVVKPDLINVVSHYESEGVEEFAIYGMCWGGRIATSAAIQLSESFKASALIHPSLVTNDEAVDVKVPMYLMPSQNEPDMIPFYEVLQNRFGDNSGHRRFDDMVHGFSGARGNFSDPLIQLRVNEVITTLGSFFDRNLNETTQDVSSSPINQPGQLVIMALITFVFVISQSLFFKT